MSSHLWLLGIKTTWWLPMIFKSSIELSLLIFCWVKFKPLFIIQGYWLFFFSLALISLSGFGVKRCWPQKIVWQYSFLFNFGKVLERIGINFLLILYFYPLSHWVLDICLWNVFDYESNFLILCWSFQIFFFTSGFSLRKLYDCRHLPVFS